MANRFLVIAVGLATTAATNGSNSPNATPSVDSKRVGVVAYVKLTDGYWQIWERDFSTGRDRQRTRSEFDKRYPAWGANERIYFRSNNDELYLLEARAKEEIPVLEEHWPSVGLVAEPHGKRFALARIRRDTPDMSAVMLVEEHSGRATFLTDFIGVRRDLDWSADGTRIVFSVGIGEGAARIDEVSCTGGPATVLIEGEGRNVHPAYSPDGRRMAFVSDRSGEFDLWQRAIDGSVHVIAEIPGRQWSPTWSPDGKEIAFENQVRGKSEIWVIDARGGVASPLIVAAEPTMDPSWRGQ